MGRYSVGLFFTYLEEESKFDSIDQQWQQDAETWKHKPVRRIYYKVYRPRDFF